MRQLLIRTSCVLLLLSVAGATEAQMPAPPAVQPVENGPPRIDPASQTDRTRQAGVLAAEPPSRCTPLAPGELLDPPSTAAIAGPTPFVVAAYFKVDTSPRADVRISWLGATFLQRFAIKREIEPDDFAFQAHRLVRPADDFALLKELSARGPRAEASLATLWCLLRRQPAGEAGALLINAVPNVFYVRDANGALGAVDVVWGGAGWEVGASALQGQPRWPANARVISR